MTEIVCVSSVGKARATQEFAANMLKEELEKDKKRVLVTRLSDPLKHICRNWFGWDGRPDDAGRSLLRYFGTNIVRARRPDFWVDFTLGLLSMVGDEWDFVIIPDCRYPNEFDLGRYGFRPRHVRLEEEGTPQYAHRLPTPDFTVVIGNTPGQLRRDMAAVAQGLVYG